MGLQNGVRVLCWDVLLGCLSEFFHFGLDVELEISFEWVSFGESCASLSTSWILSHQQSQETVFFLILPLCIFMDGALSESENKRMLKACMYSWVWLCDLIPLCVPRLKECMSKFVHDSYPHGSLKGWFSDHRTLFLRTFQRKYFLKIMNKLLWVYRR